MGKQPHPLETSIQSHLDAMNIVVLDGGSLQYSRIVVAGHSDEARHFLLAPFVHTFITPFLASTFVRSSAPCRPVHVNQIDLVGLQSLQATVRVRIAASPSRGSIFRRQKEFFAPSFSDLSEPCLTLPITISIGSVQITDAGMECVIEHIHTASSVP